ncbi:alpha/beta hydrolase [Granulicella arctica]|uniref:Alpha/beta hydrolase n=1 Tax=Granulicella arctica TaxID=940613 RepID=A0A7Y9TFK9_9BACT|nr:alpha/beta hydrolase [Granulicella arctica]NYF78911.1 hypothetical protein [Granulicella arctica]
MTYFLNLRNRPGGDEVGDSVLPRQVTIDPATGNVASDQPLPLADLQTKLLGKNVLLAIHGFNVPQAAGYQSLSHWSTLLQLDETWVFLGIIWPGNSSWLGPLCYPGEGRHAMQCGDLLAPFIGANFVGVNSISLVSHSLGGRLLLETVKSLSQLNPPVAVRQVALMAGAVNHDCLTAEYAAAANWTGKISLLASMQDEVLAKAFPAGNVFEGIIDAGHPWFQSALGRSGPKTILANKSIGGFQVPDEWKFGHGSYLEMVPAADPAVLLPQDLPPVGSQPPYPGQCTSSWSAAFISSRFR